VNSREPFQPLVFAWLVVRLRRSCLGAGTCVRTQRNYCRLGGIELVRRVDATASPQQYSSDSSIDPGART
jgi:hypothetical protein